MQRLDTIGAVERLGKSMGLKEVVERTCERHGPYQAHRFERGGVETWSACPACAQAEKMAKRAADIAAERAAASARRLEHMLGRAAIPPRFQTASFDTYQASSVGQEKALDAVRSYAASFPDRMKDGRCLALLGNVGTGKTHLATALARAVIRDHGLSAAYATVTDIVRQFKDNFTTHARTETEILAAFAGPALLVIDEIGVGWGSVTELNFLFEVVNARYNAMRPTVIVGNVAKEDVRAAVGDRVASRLNEAGARVVTFTWADYRAGTGL